MQEGWTERLDAFARNGGTVIIAARTGTRDANNHVIRTSAPGRSLSELTGVHVEDFGRLAAPGANGLSSVIGRPGGPIFLPDRPAESHRRIRKFKIGNRELAAAHLFEDIAVDGDVEIIGRWSNRYAAGTPMATSRKIGKGRVLYVGTYLTEELTAALADRTFAEAVLNRCWSIFPTASKSPCARMTTDGCSSSRTALMGKRN